MAGPARIPRDWSELLALLKENGVDFLVIGAYALAAHGHERNTKDLDLWLRPDAGTADKLAALLADFGFPDLAPSAKEWVSEPVMVQLGTAPYRVDLLNFATGLEFEQAYAERVIGKLGDTEVSCLGRDELIANKLATARTQDLADVEAIAPERAEDVRAALRRKLMQDK
jgi:hypothetical protein